MNISFGLTRPGAKESPIRVIVCHRGGRITRSTGLKVETRFWSQRKQRSGVAEVDGELQRIRLALTERLGELSTESEVRMALESALGRSVDAESTRAREDALGARNRASRPNFWDYFKEWSERGESSAVKQRRLTYRVFHEMMEGKGDWDDLDSAFFLKLRLGMEAKGYSKNTQGVFLGRLKTCIAEGYALRYTERNEFLACRKPREESFSIALTKAEVDALWKADLSDDLTLAKTRDLAMVGIFTASRFSDYSRLSEDNVREGKRLEFVAEKTGQRVVIPLSPKVKAVFARNGGHVPRMCHQYFNRRLKVLCKKIGMTEVVEVPPSTLKRLGKEKGDVVRRWELVSSHTCRRTGATLLYKSGVPIRVCRYLTGHTKDSTFLTYIKVDREEAADILARNDFFK